MSQDSHHQQVIEIVSDRSLPKKPARESTWKVNFLLLKFNQMLFMTKILLKYTPNYMSEHCGGRKKIAS